MITNTSKVRHESWLLGGNSNAIEQQESAGQRELVEDSALPVDGLAELPAEWGIVNHGPRADDPLFCSVTLPAGWRIVATDHAMWSRLVDQTGRPRASIFYKAAFYDRNAFVRPWMD